MTSGSLPFQSRRDPAGIRPWDIRKRLQQRLVQAPIRCQKDIRIDSFGQKQAVKSSGRSPFDIRCPIIADHQNPRPISLGSLEFQRLDGPIKYGTMRFAVIDDPTAELLIGSSQGARANQFAPFVDDVDIRICADHNQVALDPHIQTIAVVFNRVIGLVRSGVENLIRI